MIAFANKTKGVNIPFLDLEDWQMFIVMILRDGEHLKHQMSSRTGEDA